MPANAGIPDFPSLHQRQIADAGRGCLWIDLPKPRRAPCCWLIMLPQLIVSGIATGMLYALIALSMTVVYRATTVVNFGHGDMVAAGAYAVLVFAVGLGMPFAAALALATAVLFLFGVLLQRALMQPIIAGPHLSLAMMVLAVGYTLRGAERLEWGNDVINLARPYPRGVFMVGDRSSSPRTTW